MRPLRRHRSWLSGWLVALLLFAQWATAAYACPQLTGGATQGDATTAMAAMPDCTGSMPAMDPEQPQLCKAHCDIGQQSVQSGSTALDAPSAMAHGGALMGVLRLADAAERAASMLPPTRWAGPPAGTPPLYISLLVLRN
jgi:hypothetical protein